VMVKQRRKKNAFNNDGRKRSEGGRPAKRKLGARQKDKETAMSRESGRRLKHGKKTGGSASGRAGPGSTPSGKNDGKKRRKGWRNTKPSQESRVIRSTSGGWSPRKEGKSCPGRRRGIGHEKKGGATQHVPRITSFPQGKKKGKEVGACPSGGGKNLFPIT